MCKIFSRKFRKEEGKYAKISGNLEEVKKKKNKSWKINQLIRKVVVNSGSSKESQKVET